MSSLHKGHALLLCITPNSTHDRRRESHALDDDTTLNEESDAPDLGCACFAWGGRGGHIRKPSACPLCMESSGSGRSARACASRGVGHFLPCPYPFSSAVIQLLTRAAPPPKHEYPHTTHRDSASSAKKTKAAAKIRHQPEKGDRKQKKAHTIERLKKTTV